ncbi:HpsJ family protein [Nodosilinea sp. PGN35]|uniref:hormogonium polysaccharide biosynthesis protein HpsJ n=1 Tax=Nodosilinea sp. PGN35 TaxID=3020489 RepID=UPI0023B21661|nr:HpsJ family protein [Nodosilinea sp. TSF1-S3]MDF0369345.1 HpsJ family protein [Nodosilinea sp. TSF1-S3]
MTSEPAVTSPVISPLAAIALKVAGAIAILSALLDFLILLIPPNLTNVQWQLATTTQLVDRGIVPLVGMALLLTGFWLDSSIGKVARRKSLTADLRFWVCALASLLGLVYLLLTLLHLNAVRLSSQSALAQVSTEAGEAATQLQQRLSTELSQQQNQLGALLQNEELLAQAIQSGQLPPDIQQYRDDPEGLTQFLQQRADQAQQQIETEIGTRRAEAERQVRIEAWRSGIRISVISLLLAAGYSMIGWLGLRRLLSLTRAA